MHLRQEIVIRKLSHAIEITLLCRTRFHGEFEGLLPRRTNADRWESLH